MATCGRDRWLSKTELGLQARSFLTNQVAGTCIYGIRQAFSYVTETPVAVFFMGGESRKENLALLCGKMSAAPGCDLDLQRCRTMRIAWRIIERRGRNGRSMAFHSPQRSRGAGETGHTGGQRAGCRLLRHVEGGGTAEHLFVFEDRKSVV